MKIKPFLIFKALLFLLILSGCLHQNDISAQPTITQGTVDLSNWDFSAQRNVSLDGNWAFYWDALLSPGEFSESTPAGYFELPSGWAKYKRSVCLPMAAPHTAFL